MTSFTEFALSPPLLRAVEEMGFVNPSPIQVKTLPILLGEPTDFLGLAATGTGKTAAFGLPLLDRIDESVKKVQALVLCPTRELALQVVNQFETLGKHKNIRSICVYGGASYSQQIGGLKGGAQIVVGTPGRVIDLMERGILKLDDAHTLVLDEADEMISMGFKEDLEKVLDSINRESSQIWLFSATMGPRVKSVAQKYLRSPQQVHINQSEMLPSQIEQTYFITKESNKPDILCKLIDFADEFYGIVFCQTKALVMDLHQYLSERGYRVDCLHGDKSQDAREHSMKAFRDRKVDILVCTDVASRGLDVKDVTHVVNYSIPRELDAYVHRIGRTARSGKTGKAFSFVTGKQQNRIQQIERMTKVKITEGRVPSRKEVGIKKLERLISPFSETTNFARAQELLSPAWKEILAGMSAEEVASRFLTMMLPEVFSANTAIEIKEEPKFESHWDRESERPSRPIRPKAQQKRSHRKGGGAKDQKKQFSDLKSAATKAKKKKPRRHDKNKKRNLH